MKIKSPLRYPGGKSKQLKLLLPRFPKKILEYREPFFGGGSVGLAVQSNLLPEKILVNDIRHDLICFWKQVRSNHKELTKSVNEIKCGFKNGRLLFNFLKDITCKNELEYATRYFILNRISFGGMVDTAGFSQSAYDGRFTQKSIEKINAVGKAISDFRILNGDYSALLGNAGNNVFIFLDPPYSNREGDKLYSDFSEFDHEKFATDMAKCRHKWMITYDDSEKIKSLFSFAKIETNEVSYSVGKRKTAKELIITNYER